MWQTRELTVYNPSTRQEKETSDELSLSELASMRAARDATGEYGETRLEQCEGLCEVAAGISRTQWRREVFQATRAATAWRSPWGQSAFVTSAAGAGRVVIASDSARTNCVRLVWAYL